MNGENKYGCADCGARYPSGDAPCRQCGSFRVVLVSLVEREFGRTWDELWREQDALTTYQLRAAVQTEVIAIGINGLDNSTFQQGGRFHWDAPQNSYATGEGGQGLYMWRDVDWLEIVPAEQFQAHTMEEFQGRLRLVIARLRLS